MRLQSTLGFRGLGTAEPSQYSSSSVEARWSMQNPGRVLLLRKRCFDASPAPVSRSLYREHKV